jgi:hypothetical protein
LVAFRERFRQRLNRFQSGDQCIEKRLRPRAEVVEGDDVVLARFAEKNRRWFEK